MKILSIGNSYSEDATRYLSGVAHHAGVPFKTVNLMIGGCTLARHYKNIHNDAREYGLQFNGVPTGFQVSVREALQSDEWDIVTIQQQSSNSMRAETFRPYIGELCSYIRYHAPKAKLALHQTWGYRDAVKTAEFGAASPEEMFSQVKASYEEIRAEMEIPYLVPSGQAFDLLHRWNAPCFYRDAIHASLGFGRYTLALTWFAYLTGKDIGNDSFDAFDIPVTPEERAFAIRAAQEAVAMQKG